MVSPETAGDPMSEQKWVRSSLADLSRRLVEIGHRVSATTVGRLLKGLGYSLKANDKRRTGKDHVDRDTQFGYIEAQKAAFEATGQPIISVDTKKKEPIGDFKNHGRVWCKEAEAVNVHDFLPADSVRAVPYGIYDLQLNRGFVYVGTSAETPAFAVDAIATWWEEEGRPAYPDADSLLILADGGGCNGHRRHAWKERLQNELSCCFGLSVTVCHYPTGCSKWNPIEHRLFSFISLNWAGIPLRTLLILMACIRGTTTAAGLVVKAKLIEGDYPKGVKVPPPVMEQLRLEHHPVCPKWNYTIDPRIRFVPASVFKNAEVISG